MIYEPDTRENRLRLRVTELGERADRYYRETLRLRSMIERKNLKIAALVRDRVELEKRLRHARQELGL